AAEESARVGAAHGQVVREGAPADDGGAAEVEHAAAVAEGDVVVPRGAGRTAAVAADGLVAGEGTVFDGERAVAASDGAPQAAPDELEGLGAGQDSAVAADGPIADEGTLADRGDRAHRIVDTASLGTPALSAGDALIAEKRSVGNGEAA